MMTKLSYKVTLATIAATILIVSGAAAITQQEHSGMPPPSQGTKPHHQQGMMDMSAMMQEPHHVLAMAYKDNLVNFAKALHHEASQTKPMNQEFAREAIAEMKRSFDQMQHHHRDHMKTMDMKTMDDKMKAKMADRMKQMDAHHSAIQEHLDALDKEAHTSSPDSKSIATHVAELLKQCDGMSKMHGGAMDHKMADPKSTK